MEVVKYSYVRAAFDEHLGNSGIGESRSENERCEAGTRPLLRAHTIINIFRCEELTNLIGVACQHGFSYWGNIRNCVSRNVQSPCPRDDRSLSRERGLTDRDR